MRNTIFLDIDGVLNSKHFLYGKINLRKLRKNYGLRMISKWRLFLVATLCKLGKCDVVMSSSWRGCWNSDMNPRSVNVLKVDKLLKKYGLNLVGRTDLGECTLKNKYEVQEDEDYSVCYFRGTQILKYVEDHNLDINKCLIIDDDDFDISCYEILKDKILKTYFCKGFGGFQIKHLIKGLKMLRR